MNDLRHKVFGALTIGLLVPGAALAAAPTASADSGSVTSRDGGSVLRFNDGNNTVTVCDTKKNGNGSRGRIGIRQANGTWAWKAWVSEKRGVGYCSPAKSVNIERERARVKLVIHTWDHDTGTRVSTGTKIING